VHDRVGLGEQRGEVDAKLGGQEAETVDEALGRVERRRGALGEGERAMLVDGDQVGERAADVDADAEASAQ
jgi:hypothetical protein